MGTTVHIRRALCLFSGSLLVASCGPRADAPKRQTAIEPDSSALTAGSLVPKGWNELQSNVIGKQLAYVERILGPAESVDNERFRHYSVGACHLGLALDEKNNVAAIEIFGVRQECPANVNGVLGSNLLRTEYLPTTVGSFMGEIDPDNVVISTDCLTDCANQHDPYVNLHFTGSQVDGGAEVTLIVSDPEFDDKMKTWVENKSNSNSGYFEKNLQNCDPEFQNIAKTALARNKIDDVIIGHVSLKDENQC